MKILHIVNSLEAGGAEKTVVYLHESYLSKGIESYALSLMQSSVSLPNSYSLGLKSPYELSSLFKLFSFLSDPRWKEIDIIHVQLFPSQLFVPIVVKILGLKAQLVTTEQGSFNKRRGTFIGNIIDRAFYNAYTKVTCVSQHTLDTLRNWQPYLKDRLVVIHNGVDFMHYAHPSVDAVSPQIPIIVTVGRLTEQKNYDRIIRAMHQLSDCQFEYWIVGVGLLENSLRDLVKKLNLTHKVKFLGFRHDVPQILHQSDIFLLASLWEGLSLAMVEAMAAGLPVIVSDIPEAREVILSEKNGGLLVDPNSETDIADKLRTILSNASLRSEMGHKAQLRAANFDMKRIVQEYINLYRELLI